MNAILKNHSLLLLAFAFFISADRAYACSCAVGGPVDVVFQQAPNVVTARLRTVEKAAEGDKAYTGYGGVKQSKLVVEKTFKGNLKVGQELNFAQGGGADCIWTFSEDEVGTEYLFYLSAKPVKDGLWIAGTCSRSRPGAFAAADLLYLEKLAKVRGKTRLSGTLTQVIESPLEEVESRYEQLAGRIVKISGSGKNIELKTDKNGVYEIYDLPPGKYKVAPEKIFGYKPGRSDDGESGDVEIKAGSHTEEDFDFRIDNAIGGKFFDSNGKPLKNVCLRLRPASGKEARGLFELDCTQADGTFKIDGIPEGSYVLVANEEGKVTSNEPFGTFYYPNAKKREDAAVISVGPGTFNNDLIIYAPETADVITVSGNVVLEDGKPATESNTKYVSVEFFADKDAAVNKESGREERDARAEVDGKGRFSIRILKGQKGRLFASMSVFSGMYENCPKIEKLVKSSGEQLPEIKSAETRIDAQSDLVDTELRLPIPSCKLDVID